LVVPVRANAKLVGLLTSKKPARLPPVVNALTAAPRPFVDT
jgi:hypothetical protein